MMMFVNYIGVIFRFLYYKISWSGSGCHTAGM